MIEFRLLILYLHRLALYFSLISPRDKQTVMSVIGKKEWDQWIELFHSIGLARY
jgi:hypothetical protein